VPLELGSDEDSVVSDDEVAPKEGVDLGSILRARRAQAEDRAVRGRLDDQVHDVWVAAVVDRDAALGPGCSGRLSRELHLLDRRWREAREELALASARTGRWMRAAPSTYQHVAEGWWMRVEESVDGEIELGVGRVLRIQR
jgi:hypothetical protein